MTAGTAGSLRVSVVVPAWNDRASLARLLPVLARLDAVHEIIVVEAGGGSGAEELARSCGANYLRAPAPNRGAQLNLGAARATGEALLFHHADSLLTPAHLTALRDLLRDPAVIGGAFYRKFDARHPRLRWLETPARFIARHGGTFFGDQSVFVRRETFRALGGFAPLPLMEDIEFSRRLRSAGKVVVLDPPMETSARRHARHGAWRTSLQNGFLILLYRVGFSPELLHRWYYRQRHGAPNELAMAPQPEALPPA